MWSTSAARLEPYRAATDRQALRARVRPLGVVVFGKDQGQQDDSDS
jgi:hypothetical protein